ncbi:MULTISPECIES: glycoside hydrolase family 2 protein [Halorussus]|uniref:glycoside hydrolase family 2 protein n=1 Tax=Halorussus TaxID=1070314 RepID=UPI00209D7E59|nr:sugar-binding domain-containing protein [Halorussus vallis]USZ77374.1 beta galactosidase jelly roll domain-containing protein [Halorussus vallis]
MTMEVDHDETYRTQTDLSGEWEFAPDPDDVGWAEGWYEPDAAWTDRETRSVEVPHSWQELDDYRDYAGAVWYRRAFDAEAPREGERAFLRFAAVDYEATVYVNGTELGTHRGGYLPFEFDATEALEPGENVVSVRVHDPEDISEIPHGKQGEPWYTRVSGIWGDVEFAVRPATRVERAAATPDLDDDTVSVALDVVSGQYESSDLEARVTVSEDGDRVATETVDLGETAEVTLSIDEPTYWTLETPHLYDLQVRLSADGGTVDRFADYFGMRSFETDGDRFLLNGEPIRIRGALDQAYYPETLYRPFSDDLFEREIETAKELGFNLLRKHIKPAHPDFVEAADRLGILVWEEPANPSVDTERSRTELREQFVGLVERDYNAPSVVVWSLYNEEWGLGGHEDEESLWTDAEKQSYLADFYEEASELDPTRLVCDNSGWAHVATDVNDYHRYFVSPDRAAAWSEDLDHMLAHPADNYGATKTDPDETPIVLSEFGTWGFPDLPALREQYDGDPPWFDHEFFDDPIKRPAGVDDRHGETTLPDVYDGYDALADAWQEREYASVKDVIEQTRIRDGVAGYVITEFSDIEWEFNGILEYDRTEKSFADAFAAVNDAVMVRLSPARRSAWDDETIPVSVTVVNDTTEALDATLSWEAGDRSGSLPVEVDGFDATTVEDAFAVEAADVDAVARTEVRAELSTDVAPAHSTEPVWFVERSTDDGADVDGEGDDPLIFVRGALAPELAADGFDVQHDLTDEVDVAVVSAVDETVRSFAESGGAVVQVPEQDGGMDGGGPFEFRDLPATESWNLVASFHYADSPLFESLTDDGRLGWAFDDLYPYAVASDVDADVDAVHAGYVEGWLANFAGSLVTRTVGDGTVTACTFRVPDRYGSNPVGTILINRLLKSLAHR